MVWNDVFYLHTKLGANIPNHSTVLFDIMAAAAIFDFEEDVFQELAILNCM